MKCFLRLLLVLPIVLAATSGCSDKRKDQIPTGLKELPKEGPQPVGGGRGGRVGAQ